MYIRTLVLFVLLSPLNGSMAVAQTAQDAVNCVRRVFDIIVSHPDQFEHYVNMTNLVSRSGCTAGQIQAVINDRAANSWHRYNPRIDEQVVERISASEYRISGRLRGVHWSANGATAWARIRMQGGQCTLVDAEATRVVTLDLAGYFSFTNCD